MSKLYKTVSVSNVKMATKSSPETFIPDILSSSIKEIIDASREIDGSHFCYFESRPAKKTARQLELICDESEKMKRGEYYGDPTELKKLSIRVYTFNLDRAKEILKGLENLPEHSMEGTKTYKYSELWEVLAEHAT